MTLQSSGAISLANVQTEFGGSSPIGITEYYGKASGIPTSGTISLSNFYGKSSVAPPGSSSAFASGLAVNRANNFNNTANFLGTNNNTFADTGQILNPAQIYYAQVEFTTLSIPSNANITSVTIDCWAKGNLSSTTSIKHLYFFVRDGGNNNWNTMYFINSLTTTLSTTNLQYTFGGVLTTAWIAGTYASTINNIKTLSCGVQVGVAGNKYSTAYIDAIRINVYWS